MNFAIVYHRSVATMLDTGQPRFLAPSDLTATHLTEPSSVPHMGHDCFRAKAAPSFAQTIAVIRGVIFVLSN